MTTVGVTGATGFIGTHVLRELADRGVRIVAAARRPEALAAWQGRIEIVPVDLAAPSGSSLDALAGVDTLMHLAWSGLPNYLSRHHFESELPAQYAFLRALIARGLRSLLVTGTCAEYGMESGELSEERMVNPGHAYAIAKDTLRRELHCLQGEHPVALTWARLFYMFGEGQPATSLYTQVMAAIDRGDAAFDMSAGEQLRDFLPVATVARLLVDLALRPGAHGVVNVCGGTPTSVRRLVEGWLRDRGAALQLNLGRYPYPTYEPMAFWGSRRKLDRILSESI